MDAALRDPVVPLHRSHRSGKFERGDRALVALIEAPLLGASIGIHQHGETLDWLFATVSEAPRAGTAAMAARDLAGLAGRKSTEPGPNLDCRSRLAELALAVHEETTRLRLCLHRQPG
jgi:hypothetical protein